MRLGIKLILRRNIVKSNSIHLINTQRNTLILTKQLVTKSIMTDTTRHDTEDIDLSTGSVNSNTSTTEDTAAGGLPSHHDVMEKTTKTRIPWAQNRDDHGCYICPHPECQWKSKPGKRSTASEHYRRKHKNNKKHVCPTAKCGKKFSSSVELRQHMVRKHYTSSPLVHCPFPGCSYSDKLPNNVQMHYGRKHCGNPEQLIRESNATGKKCHKCVKCNKMYTKRASVFYHIAACADGTPYKMKYKVCDGTVDTNKHITTTS